MRFYDQGQRLKHPQGKLIPDSIWDKFFRGDFPDVAINLCRIPKASLLRDIKQFIEGSYESALKVWLAMFYSHRDAKVDELIAWAKELRISNTDLFMLASCTGQLELLNRVISTNSNDVMEMIKAEDYVPFTFAAGNGDLAIIDRIVALAPNQIPVMIKEMIKAGNNDAFHNAARNGHLDVIDRLAALAPDQIHAMIAHLHYYPFCAAAGNGHLAIIDRLVALSPDDVDYMVKAEHYLSFRQAVERNDIVVVNKLLTVSQNCFMYVEQHDSEYNRKRLQKRTSPIN
jgi:hypothetical protein